MKALTENGTKITLEDKYEIKRGGEGKILTIPELPNQVAKIYLNKNYRHMSKAQKDALAVLDARFFVKPLELIYEARNKNDILGFTMEYLSPDFVPLAAFFNKNFCVSQSVDEFFKIDLAEMLIKALQSAHQKDIIIGDLSGLNVLVNLKKEVKFLDVDSYETPVHTHWGLLFDEIRDYLYQGKVSKESDYFALAVLVFNLFTHLHPFKGVHKIYKSLAERMIRKIPVFSQDPDLIIPKCYHAIQDQTLQKQFEDVFAKGKRFLIAISKQVIVAAQPTVKIPLVIIQTSLKIKEIYKPEKDEFIQKAHFNNRLGYILTNQKILIYDAGNHGYTTLKHTFTFQHLFGTQEGKWEIFTGESKIFTLVKGEMKVYEEGLGFIKISNCSFSEEARCFQIGNILVVLDKDFMRYLYLDEVIKDQIRVEQTPVFTQGFDVFNGLIQNVGGIQYVFYHSGKNISTVKSALNLQAVKIAGNMGIAVYEQKQSGETTLQYEYFEVQNLQMKLSGEKVFGLKTFAYKPQNTQGGIIFEADDDKLLVRKSGTFQILQEIDCNLLSTVTNLLMTQAGIIAFEKDFCYLLNSN